MNRRMAVAVLSLVGVFISAYLWLFKLGKIGTIACGSGGCETVQLSPQSRFLGIEVALIGLVGYLVLFGLSLVSLQPRYMAGGWPVRWLVLLSGGAFLFTLYLKSLELFVIHAICRWCVVSAVLITAIFVLSVGEARRTRAPGAVT
jgi:uncharacterized membrane protein